MTSAPAVAQAGETLGLEDFFPVAPAMPDAAEELLTAELLGPPATMYDGRTRTVGGVDPLVLAVEELILGRHYERLAAPDSLRRYGAVMDQLMRVGRPTDTQKLFVSEHMGLSDPPFGGGHVLYLQGGS